MANRLYANVIMRLSLRQDFSYLCHYEYSEKTKLKGLCQSVNFNLQSY